ncbi:MAG: glucose-1-phosphate cytidylyltransferase [Aestuariibacter sp.]
MKVVILAGGLGSRLGSLTEYIPKPMVKIGEHPILWHIMKNFSQQGINDFVIALGYKGEIVREYFYNYQAYSNDFTVNLKSGDVQLHGTKGEDWNVTCVDTGLSSLKGARLKKVERFIDDEINILTYGDGVADINVKALIDFHLSHNRLMTVTGVCPPSLFGEIEESNGEVTSFIEKSQMTNGLINGGFIVFNRKIFDYLSTDDSCDLEVGLMEKLASERQVMVYKHSGNWFCMDQQRDYHHLNMLWQQGKAAWKNW